MEIRCWDPRKSKQIVLNYESRSLRHERTNIPAIPRYIVGYLFGLAMAGMSFSSDHLISRCNSLESILSIQGKETDFVRDTSDSESARGSGPEDADDADDGEYEPVSEPEHYGPIHLDSSGESDIISTKVIEVTVRDDGDLVFADSEQTDSDGDDIDSEMDWYDYWKCAQCLADNNNPLYRYCEKCFKVRKNFFPPRPKRKNKPNPRNEPDSVKVHHLADHIDSGVDSAFASQELSQHFETDAHSKTDLKRRAESADRDRKRSRFDSDSDSSSDCHSKRLRKSKSLDKEVAPLVKTVSDPAITIDQPLLDSNRKDSTNDNLCIVCYAEPKSGVFVHGRIAHICCCYKCAVKVWAKSKRCPVCKCKVSNVLRAVV